MTTTLTTIIGALILLANGSNAKGNNIEYRNGRLEVLNAIYDYDLDKWYMVILHRPKGTEGYDYDEHGYGDGIYKIVLYSPSGKASTVACVIPGYKLMTDSRPIDSFTPVNFELLINTQWGGPLTFSNIKNELWCSLSIAGPPYFYDFGIKPITLWRRDPNDANALYFMADIRESIAKQGGTGIVPLPNLNGTYGSDVPYAWFQVRFDIFAEDFDSNRRLDFADLVYVGRDWMATDVNSVADITGPNGLPDKAVDTWDLELFSCNWLKDSNALLPPMPGEASNPVPADGATSVGADTDLTWTAGSYATSHDVYFGTTNPPPFQTQRNQAPPSQATGLTGPLPRAAGLNILVAHQKTPH